MCHLADLFQKIDVRISIFYDVLLIDGEPSLDDANLLQLFGNLRRRLQLAILQQLAKRVQNPIPSWMLINSQPARCIDDIDPSSFCHVPFGGHAALRSQLRYT